MSAAVTTTDLNAETIMSMSLFEMMQRGIDPCNPKVKSLVDEYYKSHFGKEEEESDDDESDDDKEVGLMDYRHDVTVVEKDRRITIKLGFIFNYDYDCDLPVPEDFEEKWCASYDAKEIASEAIGEEYTILDAFWSGTKLTIIVDNLDEHYSADEIESDLENNSLEDGPYEAAPGESFWVVSYGDINKAFSE